MTSAAERAPDSVRPVFERWRGVCTRLTRNERLRGYLLLLPTLLVALTLLMLPIFALLRTTFCTQVYFKIDCSFTLANYGAIFEPNGKVGYLWRLIPYPHLQSPIY